MLLTWTCFLLYTGESLHSWYWLPGLWEPGFSDTWAHTFRVQVLTSLLIMCVIS